MMNFNLIVALMESKSFFHERVATSYVYQDKKNSAKKIKKIFQKKNLKILIDWLNLDPWGQSST